LLEYGLPLALVAMAITGWHWWRSRDVLRAGSAIVVVEHAGLR
jgi:hypothetical protein